MKRIVWCYIACLCFCGCKSTKTASDVQVREELRSDLQLGISSVTIDTTTANFFEYLLSNTRIEEEQTITEYDTESGKPIKETNTKRTIAQDADKVSAKEEVQTVTNCNQLNIDHFGDKHEMVDAVIKEESVGGQESFGKWLGIVIGIGCLVAFFVLILYLRKKLKCFSGTFRL